MVAGRMGMGIDGAIQQRRVEVDKKWYAAAIKTSNSAVWVNSL